MVLLLVVLARGERCHSSDVQLGRRAVLWVNGILVGLVSEWSEEDLSWPGFEGAALDEWVVMGV
jgi:hypothetical protein